MWRTQIENHLFEAQVVFEKILLGIPTTYQVRRNFLVVVEKSQSNWVFDRVSCIFKAKLFIGNIYRNLNSRKITNGTTCHGFYIISMVDGISKKFEFFFKFSLGPKSENFANENFLGRKSYLGMEGLV